MLLPRGLAKEATEGNIRNLEKQKAIAAEKLEEEKAAAKELAEKLEKITVKIKTKGGDTGKLFAPSHQRIYRKLLKSRRTSG